MNKSVDPNSEEKTILVDIHQDENRLKKQLYRMQKKRSRIL